VEQAAEDDNDASLEGRLVSIAEIVCANIVSRKVDNNVPGPVNSHLVRDASSSCTVCDSRVLRGRPIAAEPENINKQKGNVPG
jgi:hypothetical protein